jgi:hypothetical protein
MLCLSYYCLCFLFNKIRDKEQVLPGSKGSCGGKAGGGRQRGEMAQTIYAHVNK